MTKRNFAKQVFHKTENAMKGKQIKMKYREDETIERDGNDFNAQGSGRIFNGQIKRKSNNNNQDDTINYILGQLQDIKLENQTLKARFSTTEPQLNV